MALQPGTGKIVVAGFSLATAYPQNVFDSDFEVARYNADGSTDTSFGTGGKVLTQFVGSRYDVATTVATLPNGNIVVAGSTDALSPSEPIIAPDVGLTEYNSDGTLDTAFGNNGRVITTIPNAVGFLFVSAVAVQPDGKIVVAGWNNAPDVFTDNFLLVRYNSNGSLDTSFGQGGVVEISGGEGSGVAIQPDGKIVEVGEVDGELAIVRVNSDGTLDTSFGTGGEVVDPAVAGGTSVVIQSDGKILVGGYAPESDSIGGIALVRFDPDGTVDPSFGTDGSVTTDTDTSGVADIAIEPNGQIVAVASTDNTGNPNYDSIFLVARYNSNGDLDQAFGSGGIVTTPLPGTVPPSETALDTATSVVIEADGKIVVGGDGQYQTTNPISPFGMPYVALVRYDTDGTLDPTFGCGGVDLTNLTMSSDNEPVSLISQPDGKIVASYAADINPVGGSDFGVARFLGLDLTITGPILGVAGKKVGFTGSFDDESTANTTGVTWTFGDGTSLTFSSAAAPGALTPTHVYKKFGIYDVTVTVDFASGGTATTRSAVIILPALLGREVGQPFASSDSDGFDDAIAALTDGPDADPSFAELANEIVSSLSAHRHDEAKPRFTG